MKVNFLFLALFGADQALSLGDELKALVNFDQWAQDSMENHNFSGKKQASIGVPHEDLPVVVYRLLKNSNTWASGHILNLAQVRFHNQAFDLESRSLMLMSDLIDQLQPFRAKVKPIRVQKMLTRLVNLSDKGSELSELISAWSWTVGSFKSSNSLNSNRNFDLDYQTTARAALRLRAMRADLLTLLSNLPEESFDANDDEMIIKATFDEFDGSGAGSGDWDSDMKTVVNDNANSRDIAILARHGLLDDMLEHAKVDFSSDQDELSADFIEPQNDKLFESQYNDVYDIENIKNGASTANFDDVPTFAKLVEGYTPLRRNSRLVTGESNSSSGKSQWLTLSVVGSLAALILTVTLTVMARKIKKGKIEKSGTPVQKLRRFNHSNQMKNRPGQLKPAMNGQPVNYAYRPQSFDSGVHEEFSTSSSQMSGSSGSFTQASSRRAQQVNFAPHPQMQGQQRGQRQQQNAPYPNRNRALPPPPYSKIEY